MTSLFSNFKLLLYGILCIYVFTDCFVAMWQKNNTGFVKAQSDNLPKVTVLMVSDFFAESDVFNIAETRGVKAKK